MKCPVNLLRMQAGNGEFPLNNGIGELSEGLDLNEPPLAAVHLHEEIGNNVGRPERCRGLGVVFNEAYPHARRRFEPGVADSQRLFLN